MPEILVLLVICLLIFGPARLPKLGKSMGDAVREWRGVQKEILSAHDEITDDFKQADRELRRKV